jgi:hypothetical protein
MVIRPIGREELAAFASLSDRIDANKHFLSYLTNMWASGYIRPEWCFVAESAGKFIGRIVYQRGGKGKGKKGKGKKSFKTGIEFFFPFFSFPYAGLRPPQISVWSLNWVGSQFP